MSKTIVESSTTMYQVSFTAFDCGRNIAKSKRCIKWRFGFPSEQDTHQENVKAKYSRGEEHEVTLVWSITSGKRLIKFDGEQIHFSRGKRTEKMEYVWNWNDIELEIIAYAAPPIRAIEGFCLNDLKMNGRSFNALSEIYEIGIDHINGPEKRSPDPIIAFTELMDEDKSNEEEHASVESKGNSSIEDDLSENDDNSEISYASSGDGLLNQEYAWSHDFKTDDLNPNQPPSFEDLEFENGSFERDQTTLSYEQVWGALSPNKSRCTEERSSNIQKKSPSSVRNFGTPRKSPSRSRMKTHLSGYFEKLKLGTPTLKKSSTSMLGRSSSSYKEF